MKHRKSKPNELPDASEWFDGTFVAVPSSMGKALCFAAEATGMTVASTLGGRSVRMSADGVRVDDFATAINVPPNPFAERPAQWRVFNSVPYGSRKLSASRIVERRQIMTNTRQRRLQDEWLGLQRCRALNRWPHYAP